MSIHKVQGTERPRHISTEINLFHHAGKGVNPLVSPDIFLRLPVMVGIFAYLIQTTFYSLILHFVQHNNILWAGWKSGCHKLSNKIRKMHKTYKCKS